MNSGIPSSPGDSAANDPPVTPFCYVGGWTCELCGGRHATVAVKQTPFGPACMDLCPTCHALPEPIRVLTSTAADEHRQHLTRAADMDDPRRGTQ